MLDDAKKLERKKRRIELNMERTRDAQRRKKWSKKHGRDTYGDMDDPDSETQPRVSKNVKEAKISCGKSSRCAYAALQPINAPPIETAL